jgi:hypothetical protein
MSRLAEYLRDLATMLGQEKSVHFVKVEPGSTVPVVRVEWEAEPKVRERVRLVKNREAPDEAMKAAKDIDNRLAQDNARGVLIDPAGAKIIKFPGRDNLTKLVYGPINQPGTFQGVPIKVGGENDPVPLHLEDGKNKYIVLVKRSLAKEIAQYLFSALIRVDGVGRWIRHGDGEWEMLSFHAQTYRLIHDGDIRSDVDHLRKINADWKNLDDPLAELDDIRNGTKPQ